MPTEKELAMQRKQDELQQQQQAEANAVLATQPASLARELTPKEQSMVNMTQALNPGTKVEAPAAADTPSVTEKPKYTPLYDWSSGLSMKDAYKQGKHDRDAIWMDREKWGRENDNPANFFEAMDMAPDDFDPKKTYTENVDDQKKAKAQERLERFSNFLSHLGNFIGAAAFGAPSQTLEPAQQLTARQQAVREKTEALRRAYNDRFFEQMSKQRAIERQEQLDRQKLIVENRREDRKDKELQLRAEKNDAYNKYIESQAAKNDEQAAYWKAKYQALEEGKSYDVALKEARIAQARAAARRSNILADNAANGTETETTVTKKTPFGKQTTTTKKSTRPASSSSNKPQRKKIDY